MIFLYIPLYVLYLICVRVIAAQSVLMDNCLLIGADTLQVCDYDVTFKYGVCLYSTLNI